MRKGNWIWCLGFMHNFTTLVATEAGLEAVRWCRCESRLRGDYYSRGLTTGRVISMVKG